MQRVEVVSYVLYICVVSVVDQQNVVYISKYPAILCFSVRCAKWIFSSFCRKNSDLRPDVGAPIASPSFWIMIFLLLEKQFCLVMVSYQLISHGSGGLVCYYRGL